MSRRRSNKRDPEPVAPAPPAPPPKSPREQRATNLVASAGILAMIAILICLIYGFLRIERASDLVWNAHADRGTGRPLAAAILTIVLALASVVVARRWIDGAKQVAITGAIAVLAPFSPLGATVAIAIGLVVVISRHKAAQRERAA